MRSPDVQPGLCLVTQFISTFAPVVVEAFMSSSCYHVVNQNQCGRSYTCHHTLVTSSATTMNRFHHTGQLTFCPASDSLAGCNLPHIVLLVFFVWPDTIHTRRFNGSAFPKRKAELKKSQVKKTVEEQGVLTAVRYGHAVWKEVKLRFIQGTLCLWLQKEEQYTCSIASSDRHCSLEVG